MSTRIVEPGRVVMTAGIHNTIRVNAELAAFIEACLQRHTEGDWGTVQSADAAANNSALDTKQRVISSYKLDQPQTVLTSSGISTVESLWVITDHGWAVTTVLWPSEY